MGHNNHKFFILGVFLALFLGSIALWILIFPVSASAVEYDLDYKNEGFSGYLDSSIYGNKFTATTTNLAKIRFFFDRLISTSSVDLYITVCHGVPDPTGTIATLNCQDDDLLHYSHSTEDLPYNDSTKSNDYILETPAITTPGDSYYWIVEEAGSNNIAGWVFNGTRSGMLGYDYLAGYQNSYDNYSFGSNTYTINGYIDPDVEVIELPGWTGTVQIGSQMPIQYNRNQTCIVGEACYLRVNYSFDSVDDFIYLMPYENHDNLEDAISTTTLTAQQLLQVSILLPTKGSPQTVQYCLYQSGDDTDVFYCDLKVNWVDSSQLESYFNLSCDDVCDSVATSSGTTWDDLRYGIECGFNKAMCFAFIPSESAFDDLLAAVNEMENSFPYNTVFYFTNEMENIINDLEQEDNTIGMPWITKDGEYYMLPVLSSSSVPNAIGEENAATFRQTIGYFPWIIVLILIIFHLRKHIGL